MPQSDSILRGMKTGFLPSALAGLLLWSASAGVWGQREPWDAPDFWSLGYPLAIALAALLGFVWPARSWLWGFILVGTMAPVMAWNGSDLSLSPIGLVALTVLGVPTSLAAMIAGRIRRALSRAR